MIPLPLIDSNAPGLRVESLHALGYCHRLFLFSGSRTNQRSHENVFAGRETACFLGADEEGEQTSLDLSSDKLGLFGKVDCLRRRDGSFLPYEHKRGRPHRNDDGTSSPWPSDRLQIIAYAVLLEETFGQSILEGRVRIMPSTSPCVCQSTNRHAPTCGKPSQWHSVYATPSNGRRSRKMNGCARNAPLAPVCLPEESPSTPGCQSQASPFVPPDRDGTTLHVISHGTHVGRSGDRLVVRPREGPESKHGSMASKQSSFTGILRFHAGDSACSGVRHCPALVVDDGLSHGKHGCIGWPGAAAYSTISRADRRSDLSTFGEGRWTHARSRGSIATILRASRGEKKFALTFSSSLTGFKRPFARVSNVA